MHTLLLLAIWLATFLPARAEQMSRDFSEAAGGERSFYLVLPLGYDKGRPHPRVLVFVGTDTTGRYMREWFGKGWNEQPGLEAGLQDTILVYPGPNTGGAVMAAKRLGQRPATMAVERVRASFRLFP